MFVLPGIHSMGCFHHFSLRQTGNHFHISTLDVEDAKKTFAESGGVEIIRDEAARAGLAATRNCGAIDSGRMAIFRSPFRVHFPSPASQKEAKKQ
jgi:hypothetical protein